MALCGAGASALHATPLATYVEARAAEMQGDERQSARLFAALSAADPADPAIARRAIAAALQSGQTGLGVTLAQRLKPAELSVEARLLLAGDALRRGKTSEAIARLEEGVTSTEKELFAPLVRAWERTARGKPDGAESLAVLSAGSGLASVAEEQRAAMLFVLRRPDEALPIARRVVERGGGREARLRLAYADALDRAGRRDDAVAMLAGTDGSLIAGRARLAARQRLGMAIDGPAAGYAELLIALAADLARDDSKALPIALAQVARHTVPASSEPTLLLALLLDGAGRDEDALAALARIAPGDLLAGDALDLETRLLTDAKQSDRALQRAQAAARSATASSADHARLANVLGDLERHPEAAAAYGEALARSVQEGSSEDRWTLHLLRAASLEQADRWDDAKRELDLALRLAPDNPVLLNFLGYGKLERGEDLDSAEAMIRKASALRPGDASITDSLGWALYKRGRLPEAVETLRRAAIGDPAQTEIHEHLGDALFASGRRIEARFAWQAALLSAEDKVKARIERKIDAGLTAATAAP